MARISLVPQKGEFFDLFNRAAANTVAIAELLITLLDRYPEGVDGLLRDVKELEHEGDRLTHEVVDLLNRTFVTPFDRDDMYRLAGALDDICDHIDESAVKVGSYGVRDIRAQAKLQAKVILRSATKLSEAVEPARGVQGLAAPADRAARAGGRGRSHRPRGDLRAVLVRGRPARGDPLEGHPRAARGGRRRV